MVSEHVIGLSPVASKQVSVSKKHCCGCQPWVSLLAFSAQDFNRPWKITL